MWGSNLTGALQDAITDYGGNGSVPGDLPQDATTTYAVGSSKTTEGQVLYPSEVVSTPESHNARQEVVVMGRPDAVAVLGSNDPYYKALSLGNTTKRLKTQDATKQHAALGMSSLGTGSWLDVPKVLVRKQLVNELGDTEEELVSEQMVSELRDCTAAIRTATSPVSADAPGRTRAQAAAATESLRDYTAAARATTLLSYSGAPDRADTQAAAATKSLYDCTAAAARTTTSPWSADALCGSNQPRTHQINQAEKKLQTIIPGLVTSHHPADSIIHANDPQMLEVKRAHSAQAFNRDSGLPDELNDFYRLRNRGRMVRAADRRANRVPYE
jgi:hypothetical protein